MELPLTKMQGIGNSYVLVTDLPGALEAVFGGYSLLARALSDKSYGIGSDGILVVNRGNLADYHMRVFNPDGSEAEMCGNGIRMFARYISERLGYDKEEMEVEVGGAQGGRIVRPRINPNSTVTVDMGKGRLIGEKTVLVNNQDLHGYHVDVGNPHFVSFVDSEKVAKLYATAMGSIVENHEAFQPTRTNVEFASPYDRNRIAVHVWERGAGLTLACGTGACATAFAGYRSGRTDPKVIVNLPGGALDIELLSDDSIIMTGEAEYIADIHVPDVNEIVKSFG